MAHTLPHSEIREIAEGVFGDTQESGKLDQAVVLYFTQAQLDQAHSRHVGASCDKCMMYVTSGSKCMGVYKPWDHSDTAVLGVAGVCANMFPGKPHSTATVMPTMPRDAVGYTERGPTYCGDCVHFVSEGLCRKVKGTPRKIEHGGCCNANEVREAA